MKEKTFEVMGKNLALKDFTVGQAEKLVEIFQNLDVGELKTDASTISTIIKKHFPEFMNIVFEGQGADNIDWTKVSYNQAREIIDHFFAQNEWLKKDLTGIFKTLMSFGIASAQATK